MSNVDQKGLELRHALEKAVDKDRTKDIVAALGALEQHEPAEPRWSQRLGDALVRLGRKPQAEGAYGRALDKLLEQGFLPRAVAMAKMIVALNPARSDVLDRISQDAARALRVQDAPEHAPRRLHPPPPPRLAPSGPRPAASEPPPSRLSLLPGAPPPRLIHAAPVLERAVDAGNDEVRFVDLTDDDIVSVDPSDMDAISVPPPDEAPGEPADESAVVMSKLSATALLADVSPQALRELVRAAQRMDRADGELVYRKGTDADALYAIVEGTARVMLPELPGGAVELAAGQIFGEACLVKSGVRTADVVARGALVLLRIARSDLHRIMAMHPELNDVLFNLLTGRLIANLVQTSPLFVDFDLEHRRELAHLFEVRRAMPGTVLQEQGKRSDGLYVLLMGELDMEEGGLVASLRPGSVFGHASLLTQSAADRTIRASSEALVLRMAAGRFAQFAAAFPPALDHLSELAARPVPMWPEG